MVLLTQENCQVVYPFYMNKDQVVKVRVNTKEWCLMTLK